jgi:hypothetical protein
MLRASIIRLQLLFLGAFAVGASCLSPWDVKRLEVRYEEPYPLDRVPPIARFISGADERLVVARLISSSREAAVWEIRLLDLDRGRTVLKKDLSLNRPENCRDDSARMEVFSEGAGSTVLFSFCKQGPLALTVPELSPTHVSERFDLDWYPIRGKQLVKEKGPEGHVATFTLLDSNEPHQACRLTAPAPDRPDFSADFDGAAISPDGKLLALFFTFAKPVPPGKMAFAERIGLRVYDSSECQLLASHVFKVGSGFSPESSSAMFAGPSWSWLLSGEVFKIDKSSAIEIWDWRAGKIIGELRHRRGVGALLDVSADGRFAIGRIDDDPRKAPSRMVDFVIWEIESKDLVCESPGYGKKALLQKLSTKHLGSWSSPDDNSSLNYTVDWVEDTRFSPSGNLILHISAGTLTVYSRHTSRM